MRIITFDDFIETYTKLQQRGAFFIFSKFNFNGTKRTKSAFNDNKIKAANWSIIPKLQERWNTIITGDPKIEYQEFVVKNILKNAKGLKMLSIGCGKCKQELKFAAYNNFKNITCLDISESLLEHAKNEAKKEGFTNMSFDASNLYQNNFPDDNFDIILFHASLHHFKNLDKLLGIKLKKTLKKDGLIIINEYVGANRHQFPKHQLIHINKALQIIPKKFRKRFNLNIYKNKIYGSGLIRMIMADPSECVQSESIIPTLNKYFRTKYEVNIGGNLLMMVLKDLSHHFIDLTDEKEEILIKLFTMEDQYLKNHSSDYIFGVYQNEKQ